MNGKIFKDSTNAYQDQAKILFDYYSKAAGQIVQEELRLEREIASATENAQQITAQIASLELRRVIAIGAAVAALLLFFGIGWVAFALALGAAIFGAVTHGKIGAVIAQKAQLESAVAGFKDAHGQIRRDYKVHRLGLAYVPVAREIPFEGNSFLIDLTDSTPAHQFSLSTVRRGELFASTMGELEELLKQTPMVESSAETEEVRTDEYSRSIQNVTHYDYVGALDRKLRTAAYCLEDLEVISVQLPTIPPGGELAAYLAAHGTSETNGAPVFRPFRGERFDADIEAFRSLNDMKKSMERRSGQFEDGLRALMIDMASAVQSVCQSKVASTAALIEQSNRLMFTVLKASYNHYSSKLEAEEIERIRLETFDYQDSVEGYRPFQLKRSSRVLYDLINECWVAEDGSKTKVPFALNQIQEEIVAPIVQNLMEETRLERLKIYNSIKDQKIDYLNQWHRDTEDFYGRNRAESQDLVNQMRSTFSEYIAAHNALSALENTERSMSSSGSLQDAITHTSQDGAETLASYELKSREFQAAQEEFSSYMEQLKEDIERRAEKFKYIEYYDASLRDSGAKSAAEAARNVNNLDPRRKALAAVNPYYAEVSELPPPPSVEAGAFEALEVNLGSAARNALAELDSEFIEPPRLPSPQPPLLAAPAGSGSSGAYRKG